MIACFLFIWMSSVLVSEKPHCGNPLSESDFILNYQKSIEQQFHRLYRRAKWVSREFREVGDTIVVIPTLLFDKRIDWHYHFNGVSVSKHNVQYANWSSFVVTRMYLEDFFLVNGTDIRYVQNGGFRKKPIFQVVKPYHYGGAYDALCQEYLKLKPILVFRIAGIEAWFLILDDRIVAYERHYGDLIYHESAIDYLTEVLKEDDFWPGFNIP